MNLIKFEDNVPILDQEISQRIAYFERLMKDVKAQEQALKEQILQAMEEQNILKIDTPDVLINYISSTDRETFDKKRFQKENPDLYDEYVEMKPVKASIRIKVK